MTRVVFALVLASAIALWRLERLDVVAPQPFWLLLLVLGVGYALSWTTHLFYLDNETSARLQLRIGVQVGVATTVMYLTGWGPALTMGYVLLARDNLTVAGGRSWRAILLWIALGMAAGQAMVSVRIAPSFIGFPEEYGLAALSALATVSVISFIGISSANLADAQGSLRRSEQRLRTTLDTANDAYIEIDDHGDVTDWNDQATSTFGWSFDEALGRPLEQLIIPAHKREGHRSGLRRLALEGGSEMLGKHLEMDAVHRDGHQFPIEMAVWRTVSELGTRYHAFAHDITPRKDAEAELQRSRQDFRMLFAQHPHPMWVYDLRTLHFLEVNEAALVHYGYTRAEFLSMTIDQIRPTEDLPLLATRLALNRDDLQYSGIWRHQTKGGEVIDVDVTSHRLAFDGRDSVLVMAQDISERRRLEDQLRHQALHDSLTGLPNRALLLERADILLAQSRRTNSPVAALFLDLDNFKEVNDSLGHLVGDELLQAVATRLFTAVREADTVGRIGGDEFLVLVGGPSYFSAGPEMLASHLLEVLHDTPFHVGGRNIAVSASIGIATGEVVEAADLIRNADVALYQAKALGKNRAALFRPEMQSAVTERLEMALDLHAALRNQQFELHYQPVVDLQDLKISGVEALVRWRHPRLGWVSPERFIPLAEETGLIDEIGGRVLTQACRDGARWRRKHPGITVAVNVSAAQLCTDRFVHGVRRALELSRMDPSGLVLEITESTLMIEANATVRRLQELKDLGVQLAIDDFGTGFSSLSYLRQFPVDILKIDRSFLSTVTTSVQTTVLVHSLIQLGRALGLDVIAEGIEHPDQLQALQDAECPRAQGFLFSKPVSRRRIGQILERGSLPASGPDGHELSGLAAVASDLDAPLDHSNEHIRTSSPPRAGVSYRPLAPEDSG